MLQEIYQIDIEIYVKVDISILSFPYAWLLQIIVQESYVPSKSSTLVLRLAFGGGLDGPRSPVCMDVVKIIESYGYNAVNPLYRRSSGVCCYCYCCCFAFCYFFAVLTMKVTKTFCKSEPKDFPVAITKSFICGVWIPFILEKGQFV